MPVAGDLVALYMRHHDLKDRIEPPTWDGPAHSAWEDERDQFTADCELLREDIDDLIKEWEW